MDKKQMLFKTKGMSRDLSVSAFNPDFAFENMNLRLSTNEHNTLLSWVNERGTKKVTLRDSNERDTTLTGTPIGTAVINNKLVLFTTDYNSEDTSSLEKDYIYLLEYTDKEAGIMRCTELFHGALNFSTLYPIETLVSFESQNIQKVYWVDGRNQPRVINVAADNPHWTNTSFDFIPTLQLEEVVKVVKTTGRGGSFAPGVIQYAFTYYNKNGQESNIFYVSPILYISHSDRGASPEEMVDNVFDISIDNIDSYPVTVGNETVKRATFDYIRIYSIQRTSLNGTPITKRVQDLYIKDLVAIGNPPHLIVEYTDNGLSGDSIDPTELLYKGGIELVAQTLEQKDDTLFLGNLKHIVTGLPSTLADAVKSYLNQHEESSDNPEKIFTQGRTFYPTISSEMPLVSEQSGNTTVVKEYSYYDQLNAISPDGRTVPCSYFKSGNKYRLGVQFQHKSGMWSDPLFIRDYTVDYPVSGSGATTAQLPYINNREFHVPNIIGSLDATTSTDLIKAGYLKIRTVFVYPEIQDRNIICQGVINPTLYTVNHREPSEQGTDKIGDLQAQSSWFFRGVPNPFDSFLVDFDGSTRPAFDRPALDSIVSLPYTDTALGDKASNPVVSGYNPIVPGIQAVEIQGQFNEDNKFKIDSNIVTFHSPDVEFDPQIQNKQFDTTTIYRQRGHVEFKKTLSDINIQTETSTISNEAAGFIHRSFKKDGACGIISGLFYEDYLVEDWKDSNSNDKSGVKFFTEWEKEKSPATWMVYAWNRDGSLNNDISRPAGMGIASALLSKKVISNLRIAQTIFETPVTINTPVKTEIAPQLFMSDEDSIVKLGDEIYKGNIDTILSPDASEGHYFGVGNSDDNALITKDVSRSFVNPTWWKTYNYDLDTNTNTSINVNGLFKYKDLVWNHIDVGSDSDTIGNQYKDLILKRMPVRLKYKSTPHMVFKRVSNDNVVWTGSAVTGYNGPSLPLIEFVQEPVKPYGGETADALKENVWIPCGEPVLLNDNAVTPFYWDWGDTYYQRYDCLKTYAYTPEDVNQVVEIGSFMIETYVNIDGRYDRNRGQQNNLNMSPRNFNLMNPVYSQRNNFFSYKIQDADSYANTNFPNTVTWSKTKVAGADVDAWTNMILASTLDLDGDKGEITSLKRLNDQIIAFQDRGISQILYNENVQIQSTNGVPIEIANSGKVQGKRYYSDTIGCSNKWSIVSTPSGLYFMDSEGKHICLFNGQLVLLSDRAGMNTWAKANIPSLTDKWIPTFNGTDNFVGYYDRQHQDILFINKESCLAFSEKLEAFTSFYSYEEVPYFCNLNDTGLWIGKSKETGGSTDYKLWQHGRGEYCKFFDKAQPYWTVLIGNPEPQRDKLFTNLEFRACVDGEGEVMTQSLQTGQSYIPYLPFDGLECWNEYQHGRTLLHYSCKPEKHFQEESNALKRKFRIWRCDIPRDNVAIPSSEDAAAYEAFMEEEASKAIYRIKAKPIDRMRNPWLYLKLSKQPLNESTALPRMEVHDVAMSYFT